MQRKGFFKRNFANDLNGKDAFWTSLLFIPIMLYALYCGQRPINVGSDTTNYVNMFLAYLQGGPAALIRIDPGFLVLIKLSSLLSNNPAVFLSIISVFQAICFYISGVLLLKRSRYLLIYTILLLTSPFYLSINTNIIRHGTAISIAILGMSMIYHFKNNIIRALFVFLPALFHNIAGIIAIPLFAKIVKLNMIYVWIMLVVVSYFSSYYSAFLSNFITGDYLEYLSGNYDYRKGFRIEFVTFSAIPIFMTAILPFKRMGLETKWIFNAYLIMNGAGLVMNFISYSDRLLTNSWIVVPLLATLIIKDINIRGFKRKDNKILFTCLIFFGTLVINFGFM
ncbi:EpsG family protein [Deinococcus sp. 6YEL10]|uniref:EpsG family protein n=1 Tax=Deinococcus sp. 6YEL10 TaxID=2745870 RepID=UPI001E4FA093|nr:EpsG family protein [Deinococcus sp. 6YEL10]MCD0160628.1 EpsG family protein [Deinococcus sp. 6YEL10]